MLLAGLTGELPHDVAFSREFLAAREAVERWSAATDLYEKASFTTINWQVDDLVTGEPVQVNLRKNAAQELVGILERQAAEAVEEQAKARAAE